MPRTYVKVNPPPDDKKLAEAVQACRDGQTLLGAAKQHGVSRTTLRRHLCGKVNKVGRPPVLTECEEAVLVDTLNQMSAWGYGFDALDFKILVRSYLNSLNRTVVQFKNNLPGTDFVRSFMKRNKIVVRRACNIKRARSSVSREDIKDFFNRLSDGAGDIPANRIFNYDETALSDDPGRKRVMVSRGTRRVEQVKEHSKVNISIMVCGSAAGDLLPPFVCYKSEHLYDGWTTGGPKDACYSNTKSGWFEMKTFEEWFHELFIPAIQHLPGEKLIVGDNLRSHFSPKVITTALEHDVYFTCLPPNSTHILQPLDVAVFKPLKSIWREILDNYRKESRAKGAIPKTQFPVLLSELWLKLHPNVSINLRSGFRVTGLYPRDPLQPLKYLPAEPSSDGAVIGRQLDSVLIDLLKTNRGTGQVTLRGRGSKVAAGKKLTISDVQKPADGVSPETEVSGIRGGGRGRGRARGRGRGIGRGRGRGQCSSTRDEEDSSSSSSSSDEDDTCASCSVSFMKSSGPDWIQCVTCAEWFCGKCNGGSVDPFYECAQCK